MEEKKRKELYRIILKEVEKYTPVADQTFLADLISFKVEQFIQAELDRTREEGRIQQLKEDIEQVKVFLPEKVEDTDKYWIPTKILLELEEDLSKLTAK